MQLDLTTILESAARAAYEAQAKSPMSPAWDDLHAYNKLQVKQTILPVVQAAAEETKAQVKRHLLFGIDWQDLPAVPSEETSMVLNEIDRIVRDL